MIDKIPTEELERELAARKAKSEAIETPIPFENPNFTALIETCQAAIQKISEGDPEGDHKQWVYEQAMRCVYGDFVWIWINKKS